MSETSETKAIWQSKTCWVNVLAGVALLAQAVTGRAVVSVELQGTLLAVINVVLRLVTKQAVVWK
jgi:uncharacterized membrane protein